MNTTAQEKTGRVEAPPVSSSGAGMGQTRLKDVGPVAALRGDPEWHHS